MVFMNEEQLKENSIMLINKEIKEINYWVDSIKEFAEINDLFKKPNFNQFEELCIKYESIRRQDDYLDYVENLYTRENEETLNKWRNKTTEKLKELNNKYEAWVYILEKING